MADALDDPYAGIETDEARQAHYKKLQAQYEKDLAVWEQKETERRRMIYEDGMKNWLHQRDIQKDLEARSHKGILSMAAGSFGVSFAFINQIVPTDSASGMAVLVAAWACFGLAILLSIFELKAGSVGQDIFLRDIEKNMERGYAGEPYKETSRIITMLPERVIGWLSFLSFGAGVVCLIYFVLMNVMAR